jgi:hypothetical protein
MDSKEMSNFLTAANQMLDQEYEQVKKLQRDGKYPLNRERLIEELKSNPELRQAVRDVLSEQEAA